MLIPRFDPYYMGDHQGSLATTSRSSLETTSTTQELKDGLILEVFDVA